MPVVEAYYREKKKVKSYDIKFVEIDIFKKKMAEFWMKEMNLDGSEVRSGLKGIQFAPCRIILITESRKVLHV